jgi:Taurine catabolism dioxygenase TauD, TfdA family/Gamma-butyrobetaine hydroxylase-like, N-terminal
MLFVVRSTVSVMLNHSPVFGLTPLLLRSFSVCRQRVTSRRLVDGRPLLKCNDAGYRASDADPFTRCAPPLSLTPYHHERQRQQLATRLTQCRSYSMTAAISSTENCDEAGPVIQSECHDSDNCQTVDVRVTDDGRFAVVSCLRRPSNRAAIAAEDDKILSHTTTSSFRFHATWLRHNCRCPACVQKSSGQKLIRPSLMAPSYLIEAVEVQPAANGVDASSTSDGDIVRIRWRGDEAAHVSEYPVSYLVANAPKSRHCRDAESIPKNFIATGRPLPSIDYAELTTVGMEAAEEAVLRWLRLINEYGLCLVRNVPPVDGQVQRVAELICPIQTTIYGDRWDVKSDPQPINVAYSDVELDFHMDLAYYESPPGIQFLHCVRFDECVAGGESLFVDAFHAAMSMRIENPDGFRTLTRIPATFQKIHFDRKRPVSMRSVRSSKIPVASKT